MQPKGVGRAKDGFNHRAELKDALYKSDEIETLLLHRLTRGTPFL